MEYLVFSESKMEFRYGSGLTVYSEKLVDGRLICTDYHAAGMPQHPDDRVTDAPVRAFDLEIDGQDATYGWSFVSWNKSTAADGRPVAELVLKNDEFNVELKVNTYCGENGYFTRKLFIKNCGGEAIAVSRISPLTGMLWETSEEVVEPLKDGELYPYQVGGFMHNWWGNEGSFDWREVPYNTTVEFGSDTGRSGHSHPFAIAHNKVLGGYFVCQLAWSGNWRFRFYDELRYTASDPQLLHKKFIRLCFDLAPDERAPIRVVDAGEELSVPEIHFGYTYGDFDSAIQGLHEYQRKYILAKSPIGYEPTYSAHWGYEGWDMSPERLKVHIDRVAEMGIEMFLVDAGWYGKPGTDWFKTVGDWKDERVPGGLKEVIDYTHSKGMLFGLWIEPEAIGPDSIIRREHPEWLQQRYGDCIERSLDLSKPEVEAWIEENIIDMVERYGIDMIRIDANNDYVYEGGFAKHGKYNESTQWKNVEAIYRIFDHIRAKYPNLLYENCAAGGGRTDVGIMGRFHRTQYSDWFKLPRAVRTFNGMSMCLPPETLLSVLGPAMSCERYGSIETQLHMAMQGSFYINPMAFVDEPMNPELNKLMKDYMTLYKTFVRPVQSDCRTYHHTPVVPGFQGKGWVVNEFVSADKTRAYACLFRLQEAEKDVWEFMPKGLDPAKRYKVTYVTNGKQTEVSGFELSEIGLHIRLDGPLTSQMVLFEAI